MKPMADVRWLPMTVDEYADYERRVNRQRVCQAGGVWWRRVRPFFFRPLFLFRDTPSDVTLPWGARWVGGAQHPVAGPEAANSRLRLLVWDPVPGYSIESERGNVRREIKRGLARYEIRPVADAGALSREGHSLYLEFVARTQYQVNRAREDPAYFSQWSGAVFERPHPRVLGAYHEGRLEAVSITFRVMEVLYYSVFFGGQDALRNCAADAMIHAIKVGASADPEIRQVFSAVGGMPRGLDFFYLRRGFRYLERPAMVRGNALTLSLIKRWKPEWHRKLTQEVGDPPDPPGDEPGAGSRPEAVGKSILRPENSKAREAHR